MVILCERVEVTEDDSCTRKPPDWKAEEIADTSRRVKIRNGRAFSFCGATRGNDCDASINAMDIASTRVARVR